MTSFKNNKDRYFIYEIKLPEKLMEQVKYFANQWNEELDLCIERTLRGGLPERQKIKWKRRDEICKTLDDRTGGTL